MAKKKTTTKKTDKKKQDTNTRKQQLVNEALHLGLAIPEKVTEKELKAIIQTEKLKADLPKPPPPAPVMSFNKLKNKDILIKVGPVKNGARLMQGLTDEEGQEKWKTLCVIAPPGTPHFRLKAVKSEFETKPVQNFKAVRLMQGGEKGPILETMKL